MAKTTDAATTNRRSYWQQELEKAKKRFKPFWDAGEQVTDAYRLQKSDGADAAYKDKYNILYSSTETIKPNLYAQRPVPRVQLRHKDSAPAPVRMSADLLEGCLAYLIEEEDFDELMENAVEDYLLPGIGTAWVRYEPTFGDMKNADGEPTLDGQGQPVQELLDERIKLDYVYWSDWMVGVSRGWKTVPWVSRRLWLTKEEATKRFGKKKADMLVYATREATGRNEDNPSETCEIWEIWDIRTRKAYWFSESYAEDLLDEVEDPLKLKNFFPCPRPIRAISNTRTFVPRAFYSQYKSQAETLNILTKRIRLLGEALRVVGIYDGSMTKLADVLNPASGNRMIGVDQWAMYAQNGGLKGSVDWLPIDTVVACLVQLQQAREICKQEIYEVTGFSDIVRGVSKASETLGAQNLKANWAGARVKKMQKEVQRFARDIIAIAGEVIAEHCSIETIAMFSGVDIPTPEEMQADPAAQQRFSIFKAAVSALKNEARRVSTVSIETDSTILADEESERKDRMDFLGAAGAFLQQAVPAMQATPELGPLLGAMLMFTVRTFPSSRPIEEEFEKVQKVLESKGQQGNQNTDPNGHQAKAQAAQQVAQVRAQTEGARIQADTQTAQAQMQADMAKEQGRIQYDNAKLQLELQKEQNRHAEKLAELQLREREVSVKEAELGIKQQQADTAAEVAEHSAAMDEHGAAMAESGNERENFKAQHGASMQEAGHEQEQERMENENQREEAREAREAETGGLTGDGD